MAQHYTRLCSRTLVGPNLHKSNAVGNQSNLDDETSTTEFEFKWDPDDDTQEGL